MKIKYSQYYKPVLADIEQDKFPMDNTSGNICIFNFRHIKSVLLN